MTLDEAWAEAEAALPEGARITKLVREDDDHWRAYAEKHEASVRPSEYGMRFVGGWSRSWSWEGDSGPTPAEALHGLAVTLNDAAERIGRA